MTEKEDEVNGQEALTVTPEMLLSQIVNHVGEEFVIIPTGGWMKIVETIQNYKEEDGSLLEIFEGLGVPVVPVSLAKKEQGEESSIIMPTDTPKGESKIIMPNESNSLPEGGIIIQ